MAFLLATGLLLALVLALLGWALWRVPQRRDPEPLRARLTEELNLDVAAGLLAREELDAAAHDIEADAGENDFRRSASPRRRIWPLILLLMIPLVSGVLYWRLGDWRAAIQGNRTAVIHEAQNRMIALKAYLREHPDNRQAWITLGEAESAFTHYARAADAYEHAVKLEKQVNPDLLAAWGGALMLANPGHPTDRERAIFAEVLKADPNNVRGLFYSGALAFSGGERRRGIALWKRLLAQPLPPAMQQLIQTRLAALGVTVEGGNPKAAANTPRIAITINLSSRLRERIKVGERLYVYARFPNGGPPLMVKRLRAGTFPVKVILGVGNVLMGRRLASAMGREIEVVARISQTGEALPQPGDWYGKKRLRLGAGDNQVGIEINHQVGTENSRG